MPCTYDEATTGSDTQKFALSPPYAAPERWRSERATTATDVYSLGVIAYEMAAGHRPFLGPDIEDYREQHLSVQPARLSHVPDGLAAIIDECLYKAPEARPQPANLLARLERVGQSPGSAGLQALAEENRSEVERQSEHARRQSEARTEAERRAELLESARRSFEAISEVLVSSIEAVASAAQVSRQAGGPWRIRMNNADLTLAGINTKIAAQGADLWNNRVAFDLVAFSELSMKIPADQYGYEGREHSSWFGDIQQPGAYGWFETAFMFMPLIQKRGRQEPFALNPGPKPRKRSWPLSGLSAGTAVRPAGGWRAQRLCRPLGRMVCAGGPGTAGASRGLPELPGEGSWRQR
jgi:hypothetical protein